MKPRYMTVVDDFVLSGNTVAAIKLINYYRNSNLEIEEIAYLAEKLASSGKLINVKENIPVCDIASTGGPTSLSTLLCPLYLNELGFRVVSLGVPGRPAGGIDVLAQIRGYKTELNDKEIEQILSDSGYVHFLANQNYTPADALLFKIRQKNDAQTIPNLVIASLLAKKIAGRVKFLGLDIRVSPYGNFGKNWEEAKINADLFCRVSEHLGIKTKCFLTDGRFPYQPYIGRGEALLAMANLFNGIAEKLLVDHSKLCLDMSQSVAKLAFNNITDDKKSILEIFKNNIISQGANENSFLEKTKKIKDGHAGEQIVAGHSGFLRIDLTIIRDTLVSFQKIIPTTKENKFPDPGGLILIKNSGDFTEKGEVIASVRDDHQYSLSKRLQKAIHVVDQPVSKNEMEIIENA